MRSVLPPGQRYDTIGVAPLIKGIEFGGLIADKAFESRQALDQHGLSESLVAQSRPARPLPSARGRSMLAADVHSPSGPEAALVRAGCCMNRKEVHKHG